MEKFKKILSMILVTVLVLSMVACGAEETPATTETAGTATETYAIGIQTAGGMAMNGIEVYVYADSTLGDLKQYGTTDENGKVSFTMPQSNDYVVVLAGVPKGYDVESFYSFTGNTLQLTLNSSLITDDSLSAASLKVGDVMYDFTVVTPAGETVTLSDMLAEKEMVLINFWYTTCTYCVQEFPYMQEAYETYSDKVGIIALNPFNVDSEIETFQAQYGLTFPMASCQSAWANAFAISGYPTSVMVDRYGVICLIEAGGILSLRPFVSLFEHFTGDDYEQKLVTSINDLVTEVLPMYSMPASEEIGATINQGDIQVSFRIEADDEYCWPFVIGEKNGEACVYASNQGIESSYAILYADVELKAGEAVGFDYLASSEAGNDVLYIIVDGEDIYQISGYSETETWKTAYPWVATEDGTYEVAFCYIKDEDDNAGDDTVYVKNLRVVDSADVDTATYIPRQAALTKDGFEYTYAEIVLNEEDGYYHVGSENGPLLLANLMKYTEFNEERTVYEMAYNGEITVDGYNYYDDIVGYCTHASNSNIYGYCTVSYELGELLKIVADVAGFSGDEYEWLKMCEYYEVYGTDTQLEDPIIGLSPESAYTAKLGVNVPTNYFYYNRVIMPRGLIAKFVPNRSGVYRITSRNDSLHGVEGWLFNSDRETLLTYEQDERMYNDSENVSMVYYMEAGEEYYIDIAFWDVYEVGYIYYDIEYVAPTYQHFRLCAPGYFTYDSNATGDAMYYLITGGIDVVLNPDDGKYYEDLGVDDKGNQKYGSLIYCDFSGLTTLFSNPIMTVDAYDANGNVVKDSEGNTVKVKGMIDMGGFDFSKTEDDLYILSIMDKHDGDVTATDEYLRTLWGQDYDAYAAEYKLEDVYNGIYHGEGEDLTEEMRAFASQVITGGSKERQGCVVVTERLAEILEMLMEKYTFQNVDHSWTKLCYYYDYLGPEG